jgi:hypothetical protein
VHTTELNCSSDVDTIDHEDCVLYRRRDLLELGARLRANGHDLRFNFYLGDLPDDRYVDLPPFKHDPHLKLRIGRFTTTSFGMIIRRGE